ncbi:hypothetical protein AV545_03785 [Paenibacillus jamilae]|uniref:hypothetical protein n=1 Tax=Paenibacillus jamilae TaxID=114136 RepID=UPI0007AC08F5|nr:hypothetical protein [Paenibacillus jamilae]KZE65053.1 hypothetical protein AV545_03785 [Paenibacillus jamilae]
MDEDKFVYEKNLASMDIYTGRYSNCNNFVFSKNGEKYIWTKQGREVPCHFEEKCEYILRYKLLRKHENHTSIGYVKILNK